MREFVKKKIVLDVDNVLADTAGVFCTLATERFGRSITREMIRSPKIIGSFGADPRLIIGLLDRVWEEWEVLPLLEVDAASVIGKLQSKGNQIIVATSRPLRSKNQVMQWLKKNNVPHDNFQHLGPYQPKSLLDADVLVDDDPSQVMEFISSPGKHRFGIIFDQPWNRSVLKADNVSRVSRLSEMILAES